MSTQGVTGGGGGGSAAAATALEASPAKAADVAASSELPSAWVACEVAPASFCASRARACGVSDDACAASREKREPSGDSTSPRPFRRPACGEWRVRGGGGGEMQRVCCLTAGGPRPQLPPRRTPHLHPAAGNLDAVQRGDGAVGCLLGGKSDDGDALGGAVAVAHDDDLVQRANGLGDQAQVGLGQAGRQVAQVHAPLVGRRRRRAARRLGQRGVILLALAGLDQHGEARAHAGRVLGAKALACGGGREGGGSGQGGEEGRGGRPASTPAPREEAPPR